MFPTSATYATSGSRVTIHIHGGAPEPADGKQNGGAAARLQPPTPQSMGDLLSGRDLSRARLATAQTAIAANTVRRGQWAAAHDALVRDETDVPVRRRQACRRTAACSLVSTVGFSVGAAVGFTEPSLSALVSGVLVGAVGLCAAGVISERGHAFAERIPARRARLENEAAALDRDEVAALHAANTERQLQTTLELQLMDSIPFIQQQLSAHTPLPTELARIVAQYAGTNDF